MKTVLFIGLGQIGLPMALRLSGAGFDVLGYDLSVDARAAFAQHGGRAVSDPVAAAGSADVVITMLPNGTAVEAALTADQGLSDALPQGSVVVDMSSSAPSGTIRLGERLAAKGITLLDAPVSGGVKRAVTGKLSIMVGGDGAALERVRPVLAALGETITHAGGPGAGHAAKALNNYVSAAGLVATCEALHLGAAFNLAPETLVAVLNASTGRNNTTEHKALQFIIPETYDAGFSLALMRKDLQTAAAMASEYGVEPPLLPAMAALWSDAEADLPKGADHTAMHSFLRGYFARPDG